MSLTTSPDLPKSGLYIEREKLTENYLNKRAYIKLRKKMNVSEWIKQQEQEIGHPIYRRIKVAPATEKRFPDGTIIKEPKKPFGERNTWSPEEIGAPNSKKSSRGYSEEDFTDFSLYLKHMPGCYCVDIDTKDLDDCCFADNLFNCGTYYTETKKGFHFSSSCA